MIDPLHAWPCHVTLSIIKKWKECDEISKNVNFEPTDILCERFYGDFNASKIYWELHGK